MKNDQHLTGRDEREINICAYCAAPPTTRDHVPSKVLLSKPYPPNLREVGCCYDCNQSFSADEEYLVCLLGAVLAGSVDPELISEPNAKRILQKKPKLAARIARALHVTPEGTLLAPEEDRVKNVILKLARGHAVHENTTPQLEDPESIWFAPFVALSDEQLAEFENVSLTRFAMWPEIGSRAFYNAVEGGEHGWIQIQPGRYRYAVITGSPFVVRMVLQDYLLAQVCWD